MKVIFRNNVFDGRNYYPRGTEVPDYCPPDRKVFDGRVKLGQIEILSGSPAGIAAEDIDADRDEQARREARNAADRERRAARKNKGR